MYVYLLKIDIGLLRSYEWWVVVVVVSLMRKASMRKASDCHPRLLWSLGNGSGRGDAQSFDFYFLGFELKSYRRNLCAFLCLLRKET